MNAGIFHPQFWSDHGHWGYENHTPGNSGKWKSITYRINDPKISEYDFVVIHENVDRPLKLKVRGDGFILVTGEEKSTNVKYNQGFLDQFDCIITSRDDIRHQNVMRTHYFHPWRIKKKYDELIELNSITKTKQLSAIISNQVTLPLQKMRYELMIKLKDHYGAGLDWFSKGQDSYVNDKWSGIAPYSNSLAIENSVYSNYFTEKISDCFLAFTMPLYAGCPNLKDFFDERSFVLIDPHEELAARATIDNTVGENLAAQSIKYIKESRRLVLEKYQFIAAVSDVLLKYPKSNAKEVRKIRPQQAFAEEKKGWFRDKFSFR